MPRCEAEVIKLDRGYPLVQTYTGEILRCKHSTELIKNHNTRAVIGDKVILAQPEANDKALIEEILPRSSSLVRKDPTERAQAQVLAANFDLVIIAQPVVDLNMRRLERELVLAHETGAQVALVLTKADLARREQSSKNECLTQEFEEQLESVKNLAGDVPVLLVSEEDDVSLEQVRALVPKGSTAILLGRSGVGKSSLVNRLVGYEIQTVQETRYTDGKGRHTTVSRETVKIPGAGRIVDMPGVRGLGLWDAKHGISLTFPEIDTLAHQCKFRDCTHHDEPGCAVLEALSAKEITQERYDSYLRLNEELQSLETKREEARRIHSKKGHPRGRKSSLQLHFD